MEVTKNISALHSPLSGILMVNHCFLFWFANPLNVPCSFSSAYIQDNQYEWMEGTVTHCVWWWRLCHCVEMENLTLQTSQYKNSSL